MQKPIDQFYVAHLSSRRFLFLSGDHMVFITYTLALGETNNGSMRLGLAPLKSRRIEDMRSIVLDEAATYASPVSSHMPLLDIAKAEIGCVSWDEESGQLCLLVASDGPNKRDPTCRKEIVVIDFV
jgi:hypothetical protein